MIPSRKVLLSSQKTKLFQTRPTSASSTTVATSENSTRIAIRPCACCPATIWAEPGSTRVISISVTARRKRIRLELGATRATSAGPVVRPGGRCGQHRDLSGEGRRSGQYHQSQASHTVTARRGQPAASIDLGLLGEPVGAPDLRLAHPADLLGGLGPSGGISRGRPSSSMATKTRYAEATCTGSCPAWFHGSDSTRTPTSIEVRPAQLTWADVRTMSPTCTGCEERHLVHRGGDRRSAAVPLRHRAGGASRRAASPRRRARCRAGSRGSGRRAATGVTRPCDGGSAARSMAAR